MSCVEMAHQQGKKELHCSVPLFPKSTWNPLWSGRKDIVTVVPEVMDWKHTEQKRQPLHINPKEITLQLLQI